MFPPSWRVLCVAAAVARFATKNFSERRQDEVRRITLPRTPVNKGNKGKKDKKGRGIVTQILASSKRHRARASRL